MHMFCGLLLVARGRWTTIERNVPSTSLLSWQLAPSTATAIGIPCPSVSRLRLTPDFALSVGFLPVFSPPNGAFVIAPSIHCHAQSSPFFFIQFQQSRLPHLLEDLGFYPLLKSNMHRTSRTQTPRQRLPLAPGTQHVQNSGHRLAVTHWWPPPFGPFLLSWQKRFDPFPLLLRQTVLLLDPHDLVDHLSPPREID